MTLIYHFVMPAIDVTSSKGTLEFDVAEMFCKDDTATLTEWFSDRCLHFTVYQMQTRRSENIQHVR